MLYGMHDVLWLSLTPVQAVVRPRQDLILENLLSRHQLAVLTRPPGTPLCRLAPWAAPRTELVDVTFKVAARGLVVYDGGLTDAQQAGGRLTPPTPHRKYRRTKKSLGPRTYRTRKDPFEAVWDEIRGWIEADPERTIKSVFVQLQDKYPGQYPDAQLRTLHRHVAIWRAGVILTFGDQWLASDALDGQILPRPLRASSVPDADAPMTQPESA